MVSLSTHAVLLATLAAPALTQNVLFAENFDNGLPATWTHTFLATPIDPWSPGIGPMTNSPDVYHEWFCNHGSLFRNNILVSPRIDLSGLTRADFHCAQHQLFPLQRSSNTVEISTDGGMSFTVLYDETGTWSGPGAIHVNLDAWAGLSDVRIGFHYQGVVGNEWRIDDVRVTTPQPILTIQGLATSLPTMFACDGGTPGALVVIGVSFAGTGPVPTPFGAVHLAPPIFTLPVLFSNASGSATYATTFPTWAAGIVLHVHAGELLVNGSVNLSNSRTVVLQ